MYLKTKLCRFITIFILHLILLFIYYMPDLFIIYLDININNIFIYLTYS